MTFSFMLVWVDFD